MKRLFDLLLPLAAAVVLAIPVLLVLQSLKTGATEVAEAPCPAVQRGQLLIRSSQTLISAGTERMLVGFGKAGWIEKARQQPENVKMVLGCRANSTK